MTYANHNEYNKTTRIITTIIKLHDGYQCSKNKYDDNIKKKKKK